MSDKKDLTRIEDLSEFLHQDDPDVDKLFDKTTSKELAEEDLPSLDDLEDDEGFSEPPADFGMPSVDHALEGGESIDSLEEENLFGESEDFESDGPQWGDAAAEEAQDIQEESSDEFSTDFSGDFESEEISGDFSDDFSSEPEELQIEVQDEPAIEIEEEPAAFETQDDFLSEPEPEPEFEPEPEPAYTPSFEPPPPQPTTPAARVAPENFKDLQEFAKNMSYGKMVASGNPPYSLILKNIKYHEDAEDVLIILREHGLVDDQNEQAFQQSLNNGALLVSQLSEFSAIYLAHRLRRFDLELLIGLSEELHPSKSYESGQKGLLRKENLRQNKVESVDLTLSPKTAQQVLVTTTPTLEGHHIQRYLGVLTEHTLVRVDELEQMHQSIDESESANELTQEIEKIQRELKENDEDVPFTRAFGIKEIYQQLTESLKAQAMKMRANALVGINFHLTPLVEKSQGGPIHTYKITCTANAVWVTKSGV